MLVDWLGSLWGPLGGWHKWGRIGVPRPGVSDPAAPRMWSRGALVGEVVYLPLQGSVWRVELPPTSWAEQRLVSSPLAVSSVKCDAKSCYTVAGGRLYRSSTSSNEWRELTLLPRQFAENGGEVASVGQTVLIAAPKSLVELSPDNTLEEISLPEGLEVVSAQRDDRGQLWVLGEQRLIRRVEGVWLTVSF